MAQFDLSITLEYDIITASDSASLVAKVNEAIQAGEGWQPVGRALAYKGVLCQTMIKQEPPPREPVPILWKKLTRCEP